MRGLRLSAVLVLVTGLLTTGMLTTGPATARGSTASTTGCDTSADAPKRQLRADWIASVVNIDWPSAARADAGSSRRPSSSALLRRGRRPRAQRRHRPGAPDRRHVLALATSSRGRSTSPARRAATRATTRCAFAVRRGARSATWSSTPGSTRTASRWAPTATRSRPSSPARRAPRLGASPTAASSTTTRACPQVRQLTEDVILEAVAEYDVDGVHFDDYFYPYPVAGQEFPDDATFAEYGGGFPDTRRGWPTGAATTPTC